MRVKELLAGAALALVLSIGAHAQANADHTISAGVAPQGKSMSVSHGYDNHAKLAETEVDLRPKRA